MLNFLYDDEDGGFFLTILTWELQLLFEDYTDNTIEFFKRILSFTCLVTHKKISKDVHRSSIKKEAELF